MTAALPPTLSIALAILTLMPVLVGPLHAEAATITARLCNGGSITIPVGGDAPEDKGSCHPKGCHAGSCRERDKSGNLISRKDG